MLAEYATDPEISELGDPSIPDERVADIVEAIKAKVAQPASSPGTAGVAA